MNLSIFIWFISSLSLRLFIGELFDKFVADILTVLPIAI
jgi:hypothetical protein